LKRSKKGGDEFDIWISPEAGDTKVKRRVFGDQKNSRRFSFRASCSSSTLMSVVATSLPKKAALNGRFGLRIYIRLRTQRATSATYLLSLVASQFCINQTAAAMDLQQIVKELLRLYREQLHFASVGAKEPPNSGTIP
jgi:hypothetical protein